MTAASLDDDRVHDLLVIGGGVFGAGAAREAALNGLDVVLCERGDLAEETSSRSSKLLHGGLRYLERFEFGLVRESLRERDLTRRIAPHLARPLPFLAPVFASARVGATRLRAGLWLYDLLARPDASMRRRWLDAEETRAAEPALSTTGLRGAGRYFDHATEDARLTVELAVAAAERGARIFTRAEVSELRGGPPDAFVAEVRSRNAARGDFRVRARAVVAATGPFSDAFRARIAPEAKPRLRRTSGAHVVLPGLLRAHAAILTARSDGRVFFVIPFEGRTLVGTTDRDFDGDSADPQPAEADVRYLLDEANAAFEDASFRPEDVIASFCGVRALARDDAAHPSATSRDEVVFEEPRGVVHVLGGKLTTWRAVARRLVEVAARAGGRADALDDGTRGKTTPLPGGGPVAPDAAVALARAHGIERGVAERLVRRYGSRAADVLAPARDDASLLDPVAPTIPELRAEIAYHRRVEFARTAEDSLRRRTPRLLIDRVAPADLAALSNDAAL